MRSRRAPLVAAGLAASSLLLSACHGLPGSSPVQQGQVIGRAQPEGARVIPRGPVAGSTPTDLVLDFLRAGVGADDDSGVAREYLTSRGSAAWKPDGSAVIYDRPSELRVTATKDGRAVTVTGTASALLDKEGHYVELPPGQTRSATLGLARENGEWRVDTGLDKLPQAWISRADLGRYSSYPLVYSSPTEDVTITDRRWFLQGSGLLTRLARAQLAPPPTYLQGAVTTGVPEYTDLTLGAVSLDQGVARVALSGRALNADDRSRRLMWQQLTAALTAVSGVESVQLETDGNRLRVPGLPDRPMTDTDLTLHQVAAPTSPVMLRSKEGLRRADPTRLTEPDTTDRRGAEVPSGPELPKIAPEWFRLAWSQDQKEVAGLGGDLAELGRWRDGKLVRVKGFGEKLTRPAYDLQGYLWLAGRTDAGTRLFVQPAADLSGKPPPAVNVPWLVDRDVVTVRPSADGQRVLVVSEPHGGGPSTVGVAGVLRKDGRPVGLATPIAVAGASTDVVDACWLDGETIGVLARQDEDGARVVVAQISGPSQTLGSVPGGIGITTYGGTRGIVVTTDRSTAMVRSGNQFEPLVATSDFVLPAH